MSSHHATDHDAFDGMTRALLPLGAVFVLGISSIALIVHFTARAWGALRGHPYTPLVGDTFRDVLHIPQHGSDPSLAFGSAAQSMPHGIAWYVLFAPPIIVFWVAVAAAALWAMNSIRHRKSEKSAVWSKRGDIRRLIVPAATPARGILGRTRAGLLATEDNHSTIVFGPTQSGKSTGFAIPRVLEHDGPAIVLSVKTDLAKNTFLRRNELGKVWVYDPQNATNLDRRTGWTPLHRCRTWAGAKRTADWLATASQSKLNDRESEFWMIVARQLLEPLLFAAAINDLQMEDVVRWIETHDRSTPEARLEMALERPDTDDTTAKHLNAAIQSLKASHAADGRTVSGAYTTAQTILKAYGDPAMQDCSIAASFKPADLLQGANTLYICAPSTEQEYLRPIFATIVKDVLTEAFDLANRRGGSLDIPLLVMLDEAANLARIPDLDTIASTSASHGICLVTILQSYAQLIEKWGRDRAETIFDNHRAKVLLKGSTDRTLLDHFRKLLGDEQIDQTSYSRSANHGTSTTHSQHFRPLQALHELRTMDDDTAILLYGNLPPTRLLLRPFYEDPDLRSLARPVT